MMIAIALALFVFGAVQSPTFNGVDFLGWALLAAAVLLRTRRREARDEGR